MRLDDLRYLTDAKTALTDFSAAENTWDVFVSAYNDTDRVRQIYERVVAARKLWWVLPEYGYSAVEGLPPDAFVAMSRNEADVVREGFRFSGIQAGCGRICVDITGLLPQHILYVLHHLEGIGISKFDMIYTEPESYARRDETSFSIGDVEVVRQICGFEGLHSTDMTNDVLIVGVGYDHNLVGRAILEKESARLVQLQCLPSLSADMYNESVLRLDRLAITPHGRIDEHLYFAPANDPFVTSLVLAQAVRSLNRSQVISNLYVSPLATKPQVLGFGLFYMCQCKGTPSSVIYPFPRSHSKGSSTGIGRTWIYPINL